MRTVRGEVIRQKLIVNVHRTKHVWEEENYFVALSRSGSRDVRL